MLNLARIVEHLAWIREMESRHAATMGRIARAYHPGHPLYRQQARSLAVAQDHCRWAEERYREALAGKGVADA